MASDSKSPLANYRAVFHSNANTLDAQNQQTLSCLTVTQENDMTTTTDELASLIRKRKFYEDFIVVYLDSDIKYVENTRKTIDTIHFKTFYDANKCIDYITSLGNHKVYFNISAAFGEIIIPLIYLLPQIISIYVYSSRPNEKERHEEWSKPYKMIVRGVYSDMGLICGQLQKDISHSTSDLGMKLLNNAANSLTSNTTSNCNEIDIHYQQEASFMYGQLLKELLVEMPSSPESKQQMLDYCRRENSDNASQLRFINEFQDTYSKEKAFLWYSKDSFLYRLVNKVLREQDVEAVYSLRFYLRDLHEEISRLHFRFLASSLNNDLLKVCRGLGMLTDDFVNLQTKIGGFLSINSFLSTSQDLNVALSFAIPLVGLSDRVAVLFEMEVDFYNCRIPFADIQNQSQLQEEQEVLFTMGTVFRIKSVDFLAESGVWKVLLRLTDDEDDQVVILMRFLRKEIMSPTWSPMKNFAELMIAMGKFNLAEKIYLELLQDSSVVSTTVGNINNGLGLIYAKTGRFEKAIIYYKKAHETLTDSDLPGTYNNLGGVYRDQEDYDTALSHYNQALQIDLNAPVPYQYNLTIRYSNIATVYERQQCHEKALELYEKSLQLTLNTHPDNYPSLALCYNNISIIVYDSLHDYNKAIEYLKKALAIYLSSLPPNHLDLAVVYGNLAMPLYNQHKLKEAYEIRSKNLPSDHPKILNDLDWIQRLEEELSQLQENKTEP